MSPRYDVPNAAPEPLRQVQLLVNSADVENDVDWLPDWLADLGTRKRRRPTRRPAALSAESAQPCGRRRPRNFRGKCQMAQPELA